MNWIKITDKTILPKGELVLRGNDEGCWVGQVCANYDIMAGDGYENGLFGITKFTHYCIPTEPTDL
jgi:hypothetical protein